MNPFSVLNELKIIATETHKNVYQCLYCIMYSLRILLYYCVVLCTQWSEGAEAGEPCRKPNWTVDTNRSGLS